MNQLIVGTRGSRLARWQADWVRGRLLHMHPELEIETRIISTRGDRTLGVSLPALGEQGKGLFTKEIEDEMLDRRIDLAVHSLKDLPTEMTPGLTVSAITEREDVRDALVCRERGMRFHGLSPGSVVGTSSLRRQAQLRAIRPDLTVEPARGNIETRIRKVDEGVFAAAVLAAAGLRRLGYYERVSEYFAEDCMLPAVGQGALAIQTRIGDERVIACVRSLNHEATSRACLAERAMLAGLGGGCLVPIAGLARIHDGRIHLQGLVARTDGSRVVRDDIIASADNPTAVGEKLADRLLALGAGEILADR